MHAANGGQKEIVLIKYLEKRSQFLRIKLKFYKQKNLENKKKSWTFLGESKFEVRKKNNMRRVCKTLKIFIIYRGNVLRIKL